MIKLIEKRGPVEIWEVDGELCVYGILGDPRVVPSVDMTCSIAAGA